jgi:thioredoxin-related protein
MHLLSKKLILALAFVLSLSVAYAQMTFEQGTWKEVLAKAQQQNKPIFVDFYAVWCGPCKFMTKNVFTDPEVGEYYNTNFLSYKIDAEKEELDLVASIKIDAYPSLFYFDPKGNVITKNVGALDSKGFKKFGEGVLANMKALENLPALKAAYDKNPNDKKATTDYLTLLMQAQRYTEAEPIAQKYLAQLPEAELASETAWSLVKNFVKNTESREYKYVVANQKVFFEKYGQDFQQYLLGFVNSKLNEAIKTKSAAVLAEAKNIYHAAVSMTNADMPKEYIETEIDLHYYKAIQDANGYFKAASVWIEKFQSDNFQELFEKSMTVAENATDKAQLETVKTWVEKLLAVNQTALSYVAYAVVWEKLGNKEEAKKNAKIASEKNTDAELKGFIDGMLQRLGS